jgi:hypothetical protein
MMPFLNRTLKNYKLNASFLKQPSFSRLLLLCLLLLVCVNSFAQNKYLVLDKPGTVKRIRYRVGDEIAIKLKGENHTYRDIITAVGDSELVLMDTKVPVREVRAIVVENRNGLVYSASRMLPLAGLIYFLAATLNPVLQGQDLELNRSGVIVGSAFIVSSIPFRLLRKRTYHINESHRLRVLDSY